MHKALYRVYRPNCFSDIVGQDTVIQILKNQIATDSISHAYLFSGSRGTGKTSTAKVFAKAVNCKHPVESEPCGKCISCKEGAVDIVEIDAASNNSVDNIRDIRDNVIYTPVYGKYKIYIIDEIHMLSQGAFNALLKTLEEPPPHIIFILATTEPHKIPQTVLSRVQRHDFKKIDAEAAEDRLKRILESMGQEYEEEAVRFIVQKSEGSLRDALSLLDKAISAGELSYAAAVEAIGDVDYTQLGLLLRHMKHRESAQLLRLLDSLESKGKDMKRLVADLIDYMRDVMLVQLDASELLYQEGHARTAVEESAQLVTLSESISLIDELSVLESSIKYAANPKIPVEAFLIRQSYGLAISEKEADGESRYREHFAKLEQKLLHLEEKLRKMERSEIKTSDSAVDTLIDRSVKKGSTYFEEVQAKVKLSEKEQGILEEIRKKMDQVYAQLQKNKHVNIKALLQNGEVARYVNDRLYIAYDENSIMLKNMIDTPENRQIMGKILREIFGKEMEIAFIGQKDMGSVSEEQKQQEIVQKVQEVFPDVPFDVYENEEDYRRAMKEKRK